jgi:hypothetical protein
MKDFLGSKHITKGINKTFALLLDHHTQSFLNVSVTDYVIKNNDVFKEYLFSKITSDVMDKNFTLKV